MWILYKNIYLENQADNLIQSASKKTHDFYRDCIYGIFICFMYIYLLSN